MNVIVLAAGKGTRINNVEKCLLTIKNKLLIEYSLDYAVRLKPEKIILVVNRLSYFDLHSKYGTVFKGVRLDYKVQTWPKGTMDALETGLNGEGGFPMFLMLGDEVLVDGKVMEMLNFFLCQSWRGLDGVVGYLREDEKSVKKTYNIVSFGNIVMELNEKPAEPLNNQKGTGYCVISRKLYEAMLESEENNFVEAIDYSVRHGCVVGMFNVCSEYFNVNTLEDWIEAKQGLEVSSGLIEQFA
jgi:NDP-sugar pyrophosphorylase family protein